MSDTLLEIEQLKAISTEEQQWSAHVNAMDTTGSIDSDEYLECYLCTLRMLLD